jgi:hypothetical protein
MEWFYNPWVYPEEGINNGMVYCEYNNYNNKYFTINYFKLQ